MRGVRSTHPQANHPRLLDLCLCRLCLPQVMQGLLAEGAEHGFLTRSLKLTPDQYDRYDLDHWRDYNMVMQLGDSEYAKW